MKQRDLHHTTLLRLSDSKGGGFSLYINSNILSTQIEHYSICNENADMCTGKIICGMTYYTIISTYHPHYKYHNVNEFISTVDSLLLQSPFPNKHIVISGHLNINLLEHETHMSTNNILSTMQSLNFFPHISCPTRFPDVNSAASPSHLDHIWTNFATLTSGILHIPFSDHLTYF